jgi:hypothetical protein
MLVLMKLPILIVTTLLIGLAEPASGSQWPDEANQHSMPVPGAKLLAEPRRASQEELAAKQQRTIGASANDVPDMSALLVQIKDAESPEVKRAMILMYLEGAELMPPKDRGSALSALEKLFR